MTPGKSLKRQQKKKIDALINSKLDETVKVKQLKKYGVYAAAVLKEQKLEEKFPKIVKMHPINKNEYEILEKNCSKMRIIIAPSLNFKVREGAVFS